MAGERLRGLIVVASVLVVAGVAAPIWGVYSTSVAAPGILAHCRPTEVTGTAPVNVTFLETGLPNGTAWSASIGLNNSTSHVVTWGNSNNSSLIFQMRPGIYDFNVSNVSLPAVLYVPGPASGCLLVAGNSTTAQIAFEALPLHVVTFDAIGLPLGAGWGFTLVGGPSIRWAVGGASPSLNVNVPSGTYSFSIQNGSNYTNIFVPDPAAGTLVVGGQNVTVNITFSRVAMYWFTIVESGLPPGSLWCGGFTYTNGGTSICTPINSVSFPVPNGTYDYAAQNATNGFALYVPTPSQGTVVVSGANVTVSVSYAYVPTYNLTFVASGLPGGAFWNVVVTSPAIGNSSYSGALVGNTVTLPLLPNGTYTYLVYPVPAGYVATPASGTVVIAGSNQTVDVTFS